MLNKVYIFRIDDKDFLITASIVEAQDTFNKLNSNDRLERVDVKDRMFSTTYDFRYI